MQALGDLVDDPEKRLSRFETSTHDPLSFFQKLRLPRNGGTKIPPSRCHNPTEGHLAPPPICWTPGHSCSFCSPRATDLTDSLSRVGLGHRHLDVADHLPPQAFSTAMPLHRRIFLSVAFLLSVAPLSAQIVGGRWETNLHLDGQAGDFLGRSVSGAGDVDRDGFADVILGAPLADPGGRLDAGSALVYSGATGALIWQFDGMAAKDLLGLSVSGAGDVDMDGFDDVIVGAHRADPGGLFEAGSAYVFSGATGTLIWQFDGLSADSFLGFSVSGAGDVNGDGTPDLIVGANGADHGDLNTAGTAFVYSGATGTLIWKFDGQAQGDYLGSSVSDVGDVDGDGFADVIVGALLADPGGLENAGSAFVFSGATGALIWQFDGEKARDWQGNSVSGAGDVNGDGIPDLIVGAVYAQPGGLFWAGTAFVYSGASGSLIWQFDGKEAREYTGLSVSGTGDVDLDGLADVIVGASYADPGGLSDAGSAHILSGATGSSIWQFDGEVKFGYLGGSVSGAGDVNGDGLADVIVGAPRAEAGGSLLAGSAFVFSLDPFLHTDSSTISASSGSPVTLQVDFPPSEAGFAYAVLASGSGIGPTTQAGLDIPLAPDIVFNRMLGGWNPPPLQGGIGFLDANGDAQAILSGDPGFIPWIGNTVYLAAVSFDHATLTGRLSSVTRYLTIVP